MAGIYLHIPFCKQACHYCDFHFSTSLKSKDDLMNALLKEIELRKDFFSTGSFSNSPDHPVPLPTIYFGGGTPSLLSGDEIKKLLDQIRNFFSIEADAEITLEANPDDLTPGKLNAFHEAGVNRLSIGIQSFDNDDLKWMNRAHTAAQAVESVKQSQDKGFNNITIDLIYGTPLLTDEQWKKNLHAAFELKVQHLSCYALTVEPRTALAHFIEKKKQAGVDESKQARHFELLMELAEENGFEQYEISNFAHGQHYSKHNSSYWLGEKYLGIGPSAHSFNGDSRHWNVRNNNEYTRVINSGKVPGEFEKLTSQNKFNEYVMTSLRTMWGCNLDTMRIKFGNERLTDFCKQAMQYVNQGLMIHQNQNFILSHKGKFFADRIAAEFFIV